MNTYVYDWRTTVSVYAIEASSMAEQAKHVVEENEMQDRIQVMHGKVEVR